MLKNSIFRLIFGDKFLVTYIGKHVQKKSCPGRPALTSPKGYSFIPFIHIPPVT